MLPKASQPVSQPGANAAPSLAAQRRPGRPHSALLVDDDKFMRVVMGDLLREHGIRQLTEAAGGLAAVEMLQRLQPAPDLVVCDLNMPGGDGFEFMHQLAAAGFDGGVLLVSGMDARTLNSASLMARFHRLNILATLPKPVDSAALGAALAKLA